MAGVLDGLGQQDLNMGPVLNSTVDADAGAAISVAYLYQPTEDSSPTVYVDLFPITNTDAGPTTDASVCPDATPANLGMPGTGASGSIPSVVTGTDAGVGYAFVTGTNSDGNLRVYNMKHNNSYSTCDTTSGWYGGWNEMDHGSTYTFTSAPAAVTDRNYNTYVVVAGLDGDSPVLLESDDAGDPGVFSEFSPMDTSNSVAPASMPGIAEYEYSGTYYVWVTSTESLGTYVDTWVASSESGAALFRNATDAPSNRLPFVESDAAYTGCTFANLDDASVVSLVCQQGSNHDIVGINNDGAGFDASPGFSDPALTLSPPASPSWPPSGYYSLNTPEFHRLSTVPSGDGSYGMVPWVASYFLTSGGVILYEVGFFLVSGYAGSYTATGYAP